jgi:hypothetical protein
MRRATVIVSAAVVLAGLAGCGPTTTIPTPSATSSESPTASESPTPTPEPVALGIPACEELLSLADARALFSDNTEFFGEFPGSDIFDRFEMPEVPVAIAAAAQAKTCRWGVPNSDGSFALMVAEITPAVRATLTAALGAAGFATSTSGPVTTFELERDGMVSTESAVHLFTGDVWILSEGTGLGVSGPVAVSALDALRAANPTLGL